MNLREKKGSISIFVLVMLLFMSAFLIISFAANVNKGKVLSEQRNIVEEIYIGSGEKEAYDIAYSKYISNMQYVEDGLIFWTDGYDAPVDGKWIERTNGYEGTISGVTYDEEEKGYVWTTAYSSDNIDFPNVFAFGEKYTVEVVINQDLNTSTERYTTILYSGAYPNNPRFYSSYSPSTSENWVAFYGYGVDLYYDYSRLSFTPNEKHRLYFSRDLSYDTSIDFGVDVTNKNLVGRGSKVFGNQLGDSTQIVIGNVGSGGRSIKGTIHCVRIYNRKLTTEELQKNYLVDRFRFDF